MDERTAAVRAILASLEGACEVLEEPWGAIVANPEFHLIHMGNFAWVRELPDGGLGAVLARADDVFGPYGIPHRHVFVEDPALAERLGPELLEAGYVLRTSHVMVSRRAAELSANPDVALRPARDQATRDDHDAVAGLIDEEQGYGYEVSHQLLGLQWRRAGAIGREVYVAYLGGEPAGVVSLDGLAGVGIVPEVATVPALRGRGVAATMVLAMRRRAVEKGLDPLCLETAAKDTAWRMYERLGFDRVGTLASFLREDVR